MIDSVIPSIKAEVLTPTYGKFIVEQLERGQGITLGVALRRVLLSSILGTAPSWVKIEGVLHEFSILPGVVEDVVEIVLNLKRLPVKLADGVDNAVIILSAEGTKKVTAGDIRPHSDVEIIDPNYYVATITDEKARLHMEIELVKSKGYIPAEKHKQTGEIGIIPVDSLFSPITKINYAVEDMRVGQAMDYNRLILEIWTDGSISPEDALCEAANLLIKHFNIILGISPKFKELRPGVGKSEENLNTLLSDIDFSSRVKKLFSAMEVEIVGDIIKYTEKELLKRDNFGKVSLREIKEKLVAMGLSFAE